MRFPFSRHARRAAATALAAGAAVALVATAAQAAPPPSPGNPPRPGIIGGTEVPNDAYPFMAALLEKGPGSALKRQFCGGSLIGSGVVMTAAHCVAGEDPKKMQVTVSRTVLSNNRQGQVRNVAAIAVHPRYGKTPGYDFALIDLAKPVNGITPIKMPTPGTDGLIRPGAKAIVTGWGNTDTELGHFPDRLRQVNVPLLSHDECKISYGTYNRATDICAGVEGRDSCQGDSGGPMFRTVPGRQAFIQIGVVSYGEGCAAQGGPGVYTSTSSAVLWKTMGQSAEGRRLLRKLGR